MKAEPSSTTVNITYEAGKVQRYHTHPRFARLGQTDADHSWGVAALILQMHPNPSKELLTAAILHDTGERFAGDLPAPVKRDNPELAKAHALMEDQLRHAFIFRGDYDLDASDTDWLKLCDMVECVLYASVTIPDILNTGPWKEIINLLSGATVSPPPLVTFNEVIAAAVSRAGCAEAPNRKEYTLNKQPG